MTRTPGRITAKDKAALGTDTPEIPDKRYFKIGEVCQLTGVKQHVLRYWEDEFRCLRPKRAQSKQRLYRRADVLMVLEIRKLLKDEGFTISGARKAIEQTVAKGGIEGLPLSPDSGAEVIGQLKSELKDLQRILDK